MDVKYPCQRTYTQKFPGLTPRSSSAFLPSVAVFLGSPTQCWALLIRHRALRFLIVPCLLGSRSICSTVQSTSTQIFQTNFKSVCPNKFIHTHTKCGVLSHSLLFCHLSTLLIQVYNPEAKSLSGHLLRIATYAQLITEAASRHGCLSSSHPLLSL